MLPGESHGKLNSVFVWVLASYQDGARATQNTKFRSASLISSSHALTQSTMSPLYTVLMLLLVAPMEALVVGTAPRTGLVRASAARMDTPPPPGKGSPLGGTVDQDGKSNVWAVEPQVKVEKTDKGLLQFAPIAAVAVAAVLSVPLLPILFASNPDQGEQRESFFFRARSSHRKPFADLFYSALLCAA